MMVAHLLGIARLEDESVDEDAVGLFHVRRRQKHDIPPLLERLIARGLDEVVSVARHLARDVSRNDTPCVFERLIAVIVSDGDRDEPLNRRPVGQEFA